MFDEFFKYEDGHVVNKATGHIYSNSNNEGYIRIRFLGREFRAHRIIWSLFNGEIPEGMLVDHIDGNVSNNRIENLRLVTRQQNKANSRGDWNKPSKLPRGVTINPSGNYRSRVMYKGVTYSLGTFKTIEEAENAVKEKHLELNGEFSIYNR
jgi:hypothetical protein